MVVVGVIGGLLRPRPARFGQPRAAGLVFAAAAAQVASAATSGAVHAALLVTGLVLGGVWIVMQRRHLASVLLGLGVGLNVAVISLNGGMPVDSAALARVGRGDTDVTRGFLYKHVAMTGTTSLSWLGDRIPVPIQRNVISVGDVLMGVAICLWVADSVGGWANARRSAGAVDREHRRSSGREVVGGSE
jgi:hypothetical protein